MDKFNIENVLKSETEFRLNHELCEVAFFND